MHKLNSFLNDLEAHNLFYRLSKHSEHAIMVEIAVPGERWEVEFWQDGRVITERFRRDGVMLDNEADLRALIAEFTD